MKHVCVEINQAWCDDLLSCVYDLKGGRRWYISVDGCDATAFDADVESTTLTASWVDDLAAFDNQIEPH